MAEPLKTSIGIWAFSPLGTRFLMAGYHPEVASESPAERARRVAHGLHDLYDGLEFHYPGEINEDNAADILAAIKPMDVYCLASGVHTFSKHARGAMTNPSEQVRQEAKAANRRGIDLAAELGAHFIIWPGIEGYNYPFQCNYAEQWSYFLDGIADAVNHANERGVTVFLEHKNSEPQMKIFMRDMGMSIYVIRKIQQMGVDVSHTKINMDWQHLIMNGENLAEYAELLAMEGLLGHQHANSGWGVTDDDNIVGATRFMETLELARSLRKAGYGTHGERIGFDLYPYTEDAIAAARQSLIQWCFIDDLCSKLDEDAMEAAQKQKDALAAYRLVFETLGMDSTAIRLIAGAKVAAGV
ncbi:MAG TPA: TIM barrel protein [Chloroflexota bacterium]|jgi:xylose isomerase|nr:TIM barrel protein [Chloroflexota bacterium]